jgi:hypothetical protein
MRHTASIPKQQLVNVMKSLSISVASERQAHPDLNDTEIIEHSRAE